MGFTKPWSTFISWHVQMSNSCEMSDSAMCQENCASPLNGATGLSAQPSSSLRYTSAQPRMENVDPRFYLYSAVAMERRLGHRHYQ
jgi:hypothetical protein